MNSSSRGTITSDLFVRASNVHNQKSLVTACTVCLCRRHRRLFMRIQRFLPVLLAVIMITIPSPLSAQTVTGSVGGTVSDPTGAVVPNATVIAHNIATGIDTQATTNAAGIYSIRFLPIGEYEVTVQAPGFTAAKL